MANPSYTPTITISQLWIDESIKSDLLLQDLKSLFPVLKELDEKNIQTGTTLDYHFDQNFNHPCMIIINGEETKLEPLDLLCSLSHQARIIVTVNIFEGNSGIEHSFTPHHCALLRAREATRGARLLLRCEGEIQVAIKQIAINLKIDSSPTFFNPETVYANRRERDY